MAVQALAIRKARRNAKRNNPWEDKPDLTPHKEAKGGKKASNADIATDDEGQDIHMTATVTASMQAALLIRQKQRLRAKKPRHELPSNIATKDIAPFPRYPPHTWGKAAWQEKEKRLSVSEVAVNHRIKATEAHRRWMKRNRVRDASLGDDEDGFYRQNGAANVVLYVGLGMIAIGLVIAFVGMGEKGFKTLELRLIGPSLIGSGVLFCLLRILFCTCPSYCRCFRRRKPERKKDPEHTDEASLIDNHGGVSGEAWASKNGKIVGSKNDEGLKTATPSSHQPRTPLSAAISGRNVRPKTHITNFIGSHSDDEDNEADCSTSSGCGGNRSLSGASGGGKGKGKGKSSATSQQRHMMMNGLVNPDPDAHRLEDELEEALRIRSSSSVKSTGSARSNRSLPQTHRTFSARDISRQENEIVLSPSKLENV